MRRSSGSETVKKTGIEKICGLDALLVAPCFECCLFWVAVLAPPRHETRRVTAGGTDSPVAKLPATTPVKPITSASAEFGFACHDSKQAEVIAGNWLPAAGKVIKSMLLDRISDDPAHQPGFYPKSEARQPEHIGGNPVSRRESKSGTA